MAIASAPEPIDADAFLAFSEAAAGDARHELLDGQIVAMSAERAAHARMKNAVLRAFEQEIAAKGLPCEAFPDGMAVRVDAGNVFEPDVTVRCGPPLPGETIVIDDPVVVVEVASPSTQRVDVIVKLARYFRNPAIMHYLIVVPTAGVAIHHRRGADGRIETSSHEGGTIDLEPPGLEVDLSAVFASRD